MIANCRLSLPFLAHAARGCPALAGPSAPSRACQERHRYSDSAEQTLLPFPTTPEEDGSKTCLRVTPLMALVPTSWSVETLEGGTLTVWSGGSDSVGLTHGGMIPWSSKSAVPAERFYGTTHCDNARGARRDWSGFRRSPSPTTRSVSYPDRRGFHLRTPVFSHHVPFCLCAWCVFGRFRPCLLGGDPVALRFWT
jgi:hypothetical protein